MDLDEATIWRRLVTENGGTTSIRELTNKGDALSAVRDNLQTDSLRASVLSGFVSYTPEKDAEIWLAKTNPDEEFRFMGDHVVLDMDLPPDSKVTMQELDGRVLREMIDSGKTDSTAA